MQKNIIGLLDLSGVAALGSAASFVVSRYTFWPSFSGTAFLLFGVYAVRRELAKAPGLDKLIVLGPAFLAASLALFGAEHLASAQFVKQVVPAWMPGRQFWVYFVGFALLAAAISIILKKHLRLSATLLGIMVFLFVLMVHIPRIVANPGDRFAWAVAIRDLAFAGGAWILAGTQGEEWPVIGTNKGMNKGTNKLITLGRLLIAVAAIFFSVEHFLHPEFAPGVPLEKLTPAWIPLRVFWGYLTGAVLLVAGTSILVKKQVRAAAAWLGAAITLLVLFIYLPILAVAKPSAVIEGLNYVADTLMLGGTVLILAEAAREVRDGVMSSKTLWSLSKTDPVDRGAPSVRPYRP